MTSSDMALKTIVIADNTASVRDRFAGALHDAGHRAIGVKNAQELLSQVRATLNQIDLVVLNLQLLSTGVNLVQSIRELDKGKLTILIFSGSISSAEEIRELAKFGIAGYVNEHSGVQRILPALAPYLFPDNFNRRTSTRVVLGIPITYHVGNAVTAALTLNLGKGGLGVRTMSPLAPDTQVRSQFRLPGSERDIEVSSRVVWSDHRVGMGLQFEQVSSSDQATIDEFVDQQGVAS